MMGFGRQAKVLEPEHLRRAAVAEEVKAVTEKYREMRTGSTAESGKRSSGETRKR
jgi:hypothetical protein